MGTTSDLDFQAVTDVDTLLRIQLVVVIPTFKPSMSPPSRPELRTHLNLDTDQECIKYLTVQLTWSHDPNSDPRSVIPDQFCYS